MGSLYTCDAAIIGQVQKELTTCVNDKWLECYERLGLEILVPKWYGWKRLERTTAADPLAPSEIELRPNQLAVYTETITRLSKSGAAMIDAKTGFGKTRISLALANSYNTINGTVATVVTHRKKLYDQWKSEANKLGVKVDICMVSKIPKICGMLIIDEAHCILTPKNCKKLLTTRAEYLVGLTATPYRYDCANKALVWFFGPGLSSATPHTSNITVIARFTKIQYFPKYYDGWWSRLITNQAENTRRTAMICNDICLEHTKQTFWLILVKRVSHKQAFQKMLAKNGIHILDALEDTKVSGIHGIVGTIQCIGVGFDDARINRLVIAADVARYVEQYVGRCGRSGKSCKVYDYIDSFPSLHQHWLERKAFYDKIKCTINVVL